MTAAKSCNRSLRNKWNEGTQLMAVAGKIGGMGEIEKEVREERERNERRRNIDKRLKIKSEITSTNTEEE